MKIENGYEFNLHPPSLIKRTLEFFHLKEVTPEDICPTSNLQDLYRTYPDLLGDQHEIDTSMGGRCQLWRDNPGWWKRFIAEQRARVMEHT